MSTPPTTETRKVDHIRINLEKNVQFPNLTSGLEKYRFMHQALPELDLNEIDTRVDLLGKTLSAPILISSMTGGTDIARRLNRNLAQVAQKYNIAIGVGSQRAAIEHPELAYTYELRDIAPDALLFANVGAVQLNYGYTAEHCRRAVDIIGADALILHFNVLQEAVQPEGDVNFKGLIDKVADVVAKVGVPVIAKEVGWGFSEQNCRDLAAAGIAVIDVAGAGGTSWSEVEYHRAPTNFHAQVAACFADWGIPTATAIRYAVENAPGVEVIASGGIKNGLDIAKCIALGAKVGGLAGQFLKAADVSVEATEELAEILIRQLQVAMLCAGAKDIAALQNTPLIRVE